MLLWGINFHFHREFIVLAQHILYRIQIVLTHIRQTTTIVIPISAESLVCTMYIIGFVGSRTQPHIIVKFLGNRLLSKVILTHPEELPGETCGTRYGNLQRPTQFTTLYQFLQRLHRCCQTIEGICKAEPSVQSQYASITLHSFCHSLTLAYGTCHRFLQPDILSCTSCLHSHNGMPMRRCRYVDDVCSAVLYQVAEILIGLYILLQIVFCSLHSIRQMLGIYITHSHQSAGL